jgi:hypothetical protein
MYKQFDQKTEISQRVNTLFERIVLNSQSFTNDSYVRKYNNASYYHMSNSLTGYLGYYQTMFDTTPITSPTANALCDISFGMSTGSTHYATTVVQQAEKNNIYKIMANTLLGSPTKQFSWAGTTYSDLFFVTFKRNVFKDYFRDRYYTMWLSASSGGPTNTLTASDSCATTLGEEYAGNYGALFSCSSGVVQGLCFYNAGVVALATTSFYGPYFSGSWHMNDLLTGSTIDCVVDGVRNHIRYVDIHPATRIHSTVYKCVLFDKEYNYSSNPTYTDDTGLIRVMSGSLSLTPQESRTYITSIGGYDDLDNLLWVAKLSSPLLKNASLSTILSVRLDY